MTKITVRIPTPLRCYTGGRDEVEVAGDTVGSALTALDSAHHGLLDRVLGPDGQPRQFVNVFLGGSNVRELGGMNAPLRQGDVIAIVPAVAGGGTPHTPTAFAAPKGAQADRGPLCTADPLRGREAVLREFPTAPLGTARREA